MVRTCKAFLPIFKDQAPRHSPRHYSDARIINMISAAGLNAFGAPGGVGYEASKNAAEAFTASLRWEMKKLWNVDVTAINPTFHETAMVSTVFDNFTNTWNQLSPELREDYGQGE
jgi:NAD(P)-dependent dehydrogenase (short-subunit alcohol dehydrogenase family)